MLFFAFLTCYISYYTIVGYGLSVKNIKFVPKRKLNICEGKRAGKDHTCNE